MGANKGARFKKKKKNKHKNVEFSPTHQIYESYIVFSTRFNGYSLRKGNFIVFIFASLLNGTTSTLKGKTFLVGPVKERICFKGSKLFPSRVGPIRGDPAFSEPTGSDELNFPAEKDMM